MRMRMRRRTYPSRLHSLILQPRNRREVEMAASREPERTGCRYGDIATDCRHGGDPPSADAQAGVVQAAEEWATTVDDPAAWSDVAPAYSTEVAQYNNQPMGARGYIPLIEAPAVSLVHDETLA